MATWMGCDVGEFPFTYLGLPIGENMRRIKAWNPVVEKFKKRLADWRAKTMSFGGRLTLVKTVLGSLPLYYFSMFRVPMSVLKNLERIRKNFFWGGGSGEDKKLAWVKWDSVITTYGEGGLNIGSLRAKNLALLGKWWWRFRKEGDGLWVRVIKSIHGEFGGMMGNRVEGGGKKGGGVWCNIINVGEELDRVGIEFSSSFVGVLGDGRNIRFWVDRWVDNRRLCDRFPRLFHLDRKKEGNVMDKGTWVNEGWHWEWDWVRDIRGRVCKEFDDLLSVLQDVVVVSNCRDKWRWELVEDGEFKVKALTRLVEEKILQVENDDQETIWNKLVPKKVNIFIWRVLKGRIPVRVELDRRCIDLDSVLCPSCNNCVESCAHSLVTCDLAMGVWEKIFSWWKMGGVNAFSIGELFSSYGNINIPGAFSRVWQAVLWTSGYFIWKERNARVFGNKVSSTNKIVQDIQLKSFEWITRRSNNYKEVNWQQWMFDPIKCGIR